MKIWINIDMLTLFHGSWSPNMLNIRSIFLEEFVIHARKEWLTGLFHNALWNIVVDLLLDALDQLIFSFLLLLHLKYDITSVVRSGRSWSSSLRYLLRCVVVWASIRDNHTTSWLWRNSSFQRLFECIGRLSAGLILSRIGFLPCNPAMHDSGLHP